MSKKSNGREFTEALATYVFVSQLQELRKKFGTGPQSVRGQLAGRKGPEDLIDDTYEASKAIVSLIDDMLETASHY